MAQKVKVKLPEGFKKDKKERQRKNEINKELNRLAKRYNDKTLTGNDLLIASTVSYDQIDNNRDRLKQTRNMLEKLIPVAEGLYKTRPGQSSAYALTNLVNLYNEILQGIEASTDYESLADVIYQDVFVPFLEEIIKILGQLVKKHSNRFSHGKPNLEQEKIKSGFESMYRSFGSQCEELMVEVKEKVKDVIVGNG